MFLCLGNIYCIKCFLIHNENVKAQIFIRKNTLILHLFITFHRFLKISKVHVSLFISGYSLPFLCNPMELSTYTLKLSDNWASSTSHVFASDVILSQAVTVHIAITEGWHLDLQSLTLSLVYLLSSGKSPDSFAWSKNTTIHLVLAT